MLKFIWIGIGVAMVASIIFVVKWGIRPQAISILGVSRFSSPQDIGKTIFDQAAPIVRTHRVVVLGGIPDSPISQQIALGFVNEAASLGVHFHQVLAQAGQFSVFSSYAKPIHFNADLDQIASAIKALGDNERLLILTVNVYSSHLPPDSPIHRLEKQVGHSILTFSVGPLAVDPGEIGTLSPPCTGFDNDANGTRNLGCAILLRSRQVFDHKVDLTQYAATLDQEGMQDYLLLVHPPANRPVSK